MNERKLLLGWKAITAYTGVSRLLMIRYAYPVHDCDRAANHGYGVCAYTDELDAHREAMSVQHRRHEQDERVLAALMRRLSEARGKHPVFAEGKYHALGIIGAEYHELEKAVEYESAERMADEALDVAVTALRLWCGEHEVEDGVV